MIKLSKRLSLAYSLVPKGSNCADIGADHGQLIGSLIENHLINKGFASENKFGPFKTLDKALNQFKNENLIISLSDGLRDLPNEFDTVCILGMGGDTIIKILNDHPEKLKNINHLIISAHTKNYEVKKYLLSNGFKISNEVGTFDPYPHYYQVILFEKGKSNESDLDLRFSKILLDNHDQDFIKHYEDEINKLNEILNRENLPEEKREKIKEEIKNIQNYIYNRKEVKNMDLEKEIIIVPNFPKKGVQFLDVTSLLENGEAYNEAIDKMSKLAKEMGAEVIVGPEARGFFFGCPVATKLGLGFVPVRKPGKLPRETISYTYDLEYGTDTLSMHKDSIKKGQKVVIVDDIVAIGGTLGAVKHMVEELGGQVVGMVALCGLTNLPGVKKLEKDNLKCLIYSNVEDK